MEIECISFLIIMEVITMKRRTHKNFMLVMDILQDVKHYSRSDAEKLTRLVFDNVENDSGKGKLNRSAEYFIEKILPAEEYYEAYRQ